MRFAISGICGWFGYHVSNEYLAAHNNIAKIAYSAQGFNLPTTVAVGLGMFVIVYATTSKVK